MALIERVRLRFSSTSRSREAVSASDRNETLPNRRPLTFLKASGVKRQRLGLISKSAQSSTVSTSMQHHIQRSQVREGSGKESGEEMTVDQMIRCMRYAVGDILWVESNVVEPYLRDIDSISALSLAILRMNEK